MMTLHEIYGDSLPWKELEVSLTSIDCIRSCVLDTVKEVEEAKKIVLAFDELLTNIVLYSGANRAGFLFVQTEDGLLGGLSDDGIPFDPTEYIAEEKDPFDLDTGGMGINLAHKSVEEWSYLRKNDRNLLLMRF